MSQSSETHIALIFHHLVEQLTAVCYFCSSSPALVKQFNRHVLSTHPEQRTMLWYSDQNSAKVDTKVKMSAPGVYRLVVHCPKPRSLGGTERKRRRRECRNWEPDPWGKTTVMINSFINLDLNGAKGVAWLMCDLQTCLSDSPFSQLLRVLNPMSQLFDWNHIIVLKIN